MRFFLGGGLFGNLFGGGGSGSSQSSNMYSPQQSTVAAPPTGGTQIELQRQAAEEANQKSMGEMINKRGARTSLLTSPDLENIFGSSGVGLKSLFGG